VIASNCQALLTLTDRILEAWRSHRLAKNITQVNGSVYIKVSKRSNVLFSWFFYPNSTHVHALSQLLL
jgi:hypothetical protein